MRKYIIGAIFGLLLSISITANAEVLNNMIGKVVDGTFPVKVNGTTIGNQAIVIEGTAYLPVRDVGNALNMDVSFNADLGLELKSKFATPSVTITPNSQQDKEKAQIARSQKIQDLTDKITLLMRQQNEINGIIQPYEQDSIITDGKSSKKEKDNAYFDTVNKKDQTTKAMADAKQQLDASIKENNDIVNGVIPQP